MNRATAMGIFVTLEERRYLVPEITTRYPVFNVRLDAMTNRESDERAFRLFVRIDDGVPDDQGEHYLRVVCDLAKKNELMMTLENNGVELA